MDKKIKKKKIQNVKINICIKAHVRNDSTLLFILLQKPTFEPDKDSFL